MARAKDADSKRLAALRGTPTLAEVRDALRSSSGLLVAAAAPRVAEFRRDLADELPAAFDRLCERPTQRDPGCRGKLAVLTALYDLDIWDDAFVRGATYEQREGAWGGSNDTAADVRALCGLAHAHFIRADALDVLAEMLADPERSPRAAAASALGNAGRPDASALLRYKLLVGQSDTAELGSCAETLLGIARGEALPMLTKLLAAHDERAEVIALALGASRLAAAYPVLAAWSARCLGEQRARVGYLALALLRHDDATADLLALVADGEHDEAIGAARALATFKDDPALASRLAEAAHANRPLRNELAKIIA